MGAVGGVPLLGDTGTLSRIVYGRYRIDIWLAVPRGRGQMSGYWVTLPTTHVLPPRPCPRIRYTHVKDGVLVQAHTSKLWCPANLTAFLDAYKPYSNWRNVATFNVYSEGLRRWVFDARVATSLRLQPNTGVLADRLWTWHVIE